MNESGRFVVTIERDGSTATESGWTVDAAAAAAVRAWKMARLGDYMKIVKSVIQSGSMTAPKVEGMPWDADPVRLRVELGRMYAEEWAKGMETPDE